MRKDPTWSELRLWEALRRSQLGVRFRRQHPVGPFIVDFAALRSRLIVEADGLTHDSESPNDRSRRDAYLRSRGFAVLHFMDDDINHRLESVLFAIAATLADPDCQWTYEENPW